MTERRHILVVDDHPLVRSAIVHVLSLEVPHCKLLQSANAQEAKRTLASERFDLAIVDITMPGEGGIELMEFIHATYPHTRTLVVSGMAEELFAVRALRSGASGCVSKGDQDCLALICSAVKTILSGRRFVSSGVAELLADALGCNSSVPPHQQLSNREFEILLRLGSGHSATDIARDLHISIKTVSTHRARLLTKMNKKNNADLVAYVITNNLINGGHDF